MLSSLSSNFTLKPSSGSIPFKILTWIIREAVGAVFVFSGFVKAIDPWGTLYKVEEYLSVMGISVWPTLMVVGVFLLCSIEFLTGVLLCFGCFRRSASLLALAIMCFMLPLSLWIAVFNPVADCGCFGDFLVISNWATFWKNVVLTAGVAWLTAYNRRIGWLITPAIQWIALVATSLYVICICLAGYIYQPLLDFRPYPVGTALSETSEEEVAEPQYKFIYEKDGVKKEFAEDDVLPDEADGWKFVDRVAISDPGVDSRVELRKGGNFRLWDLSGEEDVTEEVLDPSSDRLLLLMPDLKSVSIATTWKINSLYDWAHKNNIDMVAAVTGTHADIDNWKDLSMPEYPIYIADDTAIKEVARGNPAVVYTKGGIIRWKSSLRALEADDFMSPDTASDPMSFSRDDHRLLLNFTYLFLTVMAVLAALSFIPRIRRFAFSSPKSDKEEENHS